MCWTGDHECQPAMGSCPLEKVTAPSPSAQSFPSLISVPASPPPAQHPLLSSIPEEPVGAQHGTGAIAPIPSPLQSHSTTAPRHWAGEGCRVKASPRRWQSTAAPASKTEESPIHVQCKGRTSGIFFFYQTLVITPSTRAQTWLRKAAVLLSQRLLGRLTEQTLLIMTGDKSFTQNQHDPGVTDARSLPRQHSPHPTKSVFLSVM